MVSTILQNRLNDAVSAHDRLVAFTGTFWWVTAFSAIPLLVVLFLPARADLAEDEAALAVAG